MFKPNSDTFRDIFWLPGLTKIKADKKLTVVMCCQIVARKSVAAISGGDQPVDKIRNFEEKKVLVK